MLCKPEDTVQTHDVAWYKFFNNLCKDVHDQAVAKSAAFIEEAEQNRYSDIFSYKHAIKIYNRCKLLPKNVTELDRYDTAIITRGIIITRVFDLSGVYMVGVSEKCDDTVDADNARTYITCVSVGGGDVDDIARVIANTVGDNKTCGNTCIIVEHMGKELMIRFNHKK